MTLHVLCTLCRITDGNECSAPSFHFWKWLLYLQTVFEWNTTLNMFNLIKKTDEVLVLRSAGHCKHLDMVACFFLFPTSCVHEKTKCSHFQFDVLPFLLINPTVHLQTPFFITLGKFQSSFIPENKFLSWLLILFKAGIIIFSDMQWKPSRWLPRVPFSSSVISVFLPLPAGDPHFYSSFISLTSVWLPAPPFSVQELLNINTIKQECAGGRRFGKSKKENVKRVSVESGNRIWVQF